MDPVQTIAGLIFGSGGLVGAWNVYRVWKSRKRGMPAKEPAARILAGQSALNRYWQSEVAALRQERAAELADVKAENARLRREVRDAWRRVDQLEEHIYMRREPPPPPPIKGSTP